ncbi:MAG: DegT/DnrJ/EryC1/StrS family aminotransferase [Thermoplasmata archaeon]
MISIANPILGDEEIKAVTEVLKSGMLAQGKEVAAFENEFSEYLRVTHSKAVANGTAALDVALKALRIGKGDEVITTPFTFIASSNCILFQKATPVFADIDPDTFNLDPNTVIEKINSKTKAILIVHLFGQSADMDAFKEIAEDHNLFLIEDCAQAHGAEFRGKKVGTFGDIGTYSFYPTKNMTTGEGGMVVTDDDELAYRSNLIRDHGQSAKYSHEYLGYNLRMTDIGGTIGRIQLKKIDDWNKKRIENANLLSERIKDIDGLTPPRATDDVKHVYHQYAIKVEDEFSVNREELMDKLRESGIGSAVHYPMPITDQPLYKDKGYDSHDYPHAIDVSNKVLSLPVHPLVTSEDIEHVCDTLEDVGGSR